MPKFRCAPVGLTITLVASGCSGTIAVDASADARADHVLDGSVVDTVVVDDADDAIVADDVVVNFDDVPRADAGTPESGRVPLPTSGTVVNVATAAERPLPPGFSGFNTEELIDAMDYRHDGYQMFTAGLHPGFLRWPAGTPSDAYDWEAHHFNHGDWFNYLTGQYPSFQYFHDDWTPVLEGKGGASIADFTGVLTRAHASIMVQVNAFTQPHAMPGDTTAHDNQVASAGRLAAWLHAHGVAVAGFELCNEPYLSQFTANPIGQHFFTDAADYVRLMRDYATAIHAAYPGALVSIASNDGENPLHENSEWNNQLAAQTNQSWFDAITVHRYPCTPASRFAGDYAAWEQCLDGSLAHDTDVQVDALALRFPGKQIFVTEFNAAIETSGTMDEDPQGPYLRGREYDAVYVAEAVLRYSRSTHVTRVAIQKLYGNYFSAIDAVRHRRQEPVDAYNAGTTVDMHTRDFGLYYTAPGFALTLVNAAVNASTAFVTTTVNRSPTVLAQGTPSGMIDAVYAQSYRATSGVRYLVITNKSPAPVPLTLGVDGARLAAPTLCWGTQGSLLDENYSNAGAPEVQRVAPHPCAVSSSGALTIGPYSVTLVAWNP